MKDAELSLLVEELYFDNSVVLRCSTSTLYRWAKRVNRYLEKNKYEWRVRPNTKESTIEVIRP